MSSLIDKARAAGPYRVAGWDCEEPGDLIEGEVVAYDVVDGQYGSRQRIKVDIGEGSGIAAGKTLDPGVYSVWERAALKSAWADKRLAVGDRIAILYEGSEPGKKAGANPMKLFCIAVEKTAKSEEYQDPAKAVAPAETDADDSSKAFADEVPF